MSIPVFRALIVEDNPDWQQLLGEMLNDFGLVVDRAASLEAAQTALRTQPHRVAVVDLSLSSEDHHNQDGLRVLESARLLDPNCRSILLTGFATVDVAVAALSEHQAFAFLRKENFSRQQFRDVVSRALASAPLPAATAPVPHSQAPDADTGAADAPGAEQTRHALLVEDDAGWRSILQELLSENGYQAQVCTSFGSALGYLRRDAFDLAVIDLSLSGEPANFQNIAPDLAGLQLLALSQEKGIRTIVVSGMAAPDQIQHIYTQYAIFAFLEKQTFDAASFRNLVHETLPSSEPASELDVLTEREREVLESLASGMTNKEIAERLVISQNTVKRHIKAIFEKLSVHTRSAAAAKAVRAQNQPPERL